MAQRSAQQRAAAQQRRLQLQETDDRCPDDEENDPFGGRSRTPSDADGAAAHGDASEAAVALGASFGIEDASLPLDFVSGRQLAPAGALLLTALRVELLKSVVPTYRIYTAVTGGTREGAAERTVKRTLPQLLACRAQLVEHFAFCVVPALPPDSMASELRGRDMVMTFVHLVAVNPAVAPAPAFHTLLGYGDGDVEAAAKREFALTASAIFGSSGRKRRSVTGDYDPATADPSTALGIMSPKVIQWNLRPALETALARAHTCLRRVAALQRTRDLARQAAEGWAAVAHAALAVRDSSIGMADALRDVAPALDAHQHAMFWPWTREIVQHGAAHTASRLAFKRQADKMQRPAAAAAAAEAAGVHDHNVNPDVHHPTVRLNTYLQKTANLATNAADTGIVHAIVSPPLYRAVVVSADERAAESLSAGAAVERMLDVPGVSSLPKHVKALKELARDPREHRDVTAEKIDMMDADLTATWARVENGFSTFEQQCAELRGSTRRMLVAAVTETAKAERACIEAALLVADDLLAMIRADPYVDDEDRPFRNPLGRPAGAEVDMDDDDDTNGAAAAEYGPVVGSRSETPTAGVTANSAPTPASPPPRVPAAASLLTSSPPPAAAAAAASTKKRGGKARREAIRLPTEADPFTVGADASPQGLEMGEVFRDSGSFGRHAGSPDGGWSQRRREGSDEFGCRPSR